MRLLLFCSIAVTCWGLISTTPSAAPERTVHAKLGQDVVLDPGVSSVSGTIEYILWKHEKDLAMEWDKPSNNVTGYRHFTDRGHLNTVTGEMTIKQLILSDSGLYTPEINNTVHTPVRLIILTPVPKPTVTHSCDEEKTTCTFTCSGNAADAGPVSYSWKKDDRTSTGHSTDKLSISKDSGECFDVITCTVESSDDQETSEPYTNPLTPCEQGSPRIYTAIMLSVGLMAGVLVMAALHRWKTGEWFWEKDDMPWEAGFYRRSNQPAHAAQQNGAPPAKDEGKRLMNEDGPLEDVADSRV